jgi:hypothetical protein
MGLFNALNITDNYILFMFVDLCIIVQSDSLARGPKLVYKVFQNLQKRIQVCVDEKGD